MSCHAVYWRAARMQCLKYSAVAAVHTLPCMRKGLQLPCRLRHWRSSTATRCAAIYTVLRLVAVEGRLHPGTPQGNVKHLDWAAS